ncbi:MAG: RNA methyltransferase [Candidatus Shikimatogenerans bostrichidophilus]|nr:MAG: RNA methyltransferase [Candidatus Shikimatogenerans bostrichidophilus]
MVKKSIIIYGYHPVEEAIKSNFIKVLIIFINNNKISKYKLLINKIKKKKIPLKIIYKLNKNFKNIYNTQGIMANISIIKVFLLQDIVNDKKKKNIIILYNITDTKNIGSIIRTSACFNVDYIIIPNTYYIYNPNIIKISSGSIFKIKICRVNNIDKSIKFLINNNIKIISITEKGTENINNNLTIKSKESIAFILGNEETGIPKNILMLTKHKLYIPIKKEIISSLNVSVSCGIILYELNRNL